MEFARAFELSVVGYAVFCPGLLPFLTSLLGEGGVDFLGVVDREVVGELAGGTVVGDAALVVYEDRIVEFEMSERVCDQDNGAAIVAGKVVEEMYDFAFGTGIKSAGDLVTEEKLGVGDELHGESEAPLLSAGEDLDMAVGNGSQTGFLKDAVDTLVKILMIPALYPQAGCGLDRLIDGEFVVGDGELGNVADFPWFQVALLGEIAPVPPEGAFGLGVESGDGLEESGLSATGGAHDGHEVSPWNSETGFVHEVNGLAVFLDGETDLLEL